MKACHISEEEEDDMPSDKIASYTAQTLTKIPNNQMYFMKNIKFDFREYSYKRLNHVLSSLFEISRRFSMKKIYGMSFRLIVLKNFTLCLLK